MSSPSGEGVIAAIMPSADEIRGARRRLHAKAVVIAALGTLGYAGLVLAPVGFAVRAASCVVLVVAAVAAATSIMHDANHGAFSRSRRLNRMAGYTADVLGGSSWVWRFKHNSLHHAHANVVGMDTDIEEEPFARLAPSQAWRPWHRWQHLYLWPLYGFLTFKWLLVSDFGILARGKVGDHPLPRRPRPAELALLLLGKALHVTWALVIPLLLHPWWAVLAFYAVAAWVVGFMLAVIFQLAHCVDRAEFLLPDAPRRGAHFPLHQLRTTVDVECRGRLTGGFLRWLVGGLDHQVVHHLAPGLPHTIYPALARRLEEVCRERGLVYRRHGSVAVALRSHNRWLKEMGRRPTPAAA
ncbi:MAG: fatty acid desaturase family protein [Acidimicrobiales bacterium]